MSTSLNERIKSLLGDINAPNSTVEQLGSTMQKKSEEAANSGLRHKSEVEQPEAPQDEPTEEITEKSFQDNMLESMAAISVAIRNQNERIGLIEKALKDNSIVEPEESMADIIKSFIEPNQNPNDLSSIPNLREPRQNKSRDEEKEQEDYPQDTDLIRAIVDGKFKV